MGRGALGLRGRGSLDRECALGGGGRGTRQPGGRFGYPGRRKLDSLLAGKESVLCEQLPSEGSVTPGDGDGGPPPSPRSPGRAGPPSLLPLPAPTPGRCAWQPPRRISWHSAENKQRSAPVIPLSRRPRSAGRGRGGGVACSRRARGAWRGGGGAGPGGATRRAPRGHSSHSSARAPAASGK